MGPWEVVRYREVRCEMDAGVIPKGKLRNGFARGFLWEIQMKPQACLKVMESERYLQMLRQLAVSSVVSSAICAASTILGVGEATGHIRLAGPYFWFAIALGAFGVWGSVLIYSRQLFKRLIVVIVLGLFFWSYYQNRKV
jgi:hypothetical protein